MIPPIHIRHFPRLHIKLHRPKAEFSAVLPAVPGLFRVAKYTEWFNTAILPVLKEYAERTSSILDIERDRETLIQATLRNSCGLDISSDSHRLYMAVMSAVHIFVDVEDGDPVLVLTYDLKES